MPGFVRVLAAAVVQCNFGEPILEWDIHLDGRDAAKRLSGHHPVPPHYTPLQQKESRHDASTIFLSCSHDLTGFYLATVNFAVITGQLLLLTSLFFLSLFHPSDQSVFGFDISSIFGTSCTFPEREVLRRNISQGFVGSSELPRLSLCSLFCPERTHPIEMMNIELKNVYSRVLISVNKIRHGHKTNH